MASPLRVRSLGAWIDPADAFVALFGGGGAADAVDAVWLDAGPDAVEGRSFLATGSTVVTATAGTGSVTIQSAGATTSRAGRILDFLRSDIAARRDAVASPLGWAGWLGYECGLDALGLPVASAGGADAALLLTERALVFDHARRTVELRTPEGDPWADAAAARLLQSAGAASSYERAHPVPAATARWRHDDDAYLAMIRACQDAITAGDAYLLCLTNTAEARTGADPLAVHLRLRRASPTHHGGFLRIAGECLVSSSPEQFLAVTAEGRVRTKPIKGTRPRGRTVAADLELRAELEASEKERAENVMIVDLMRNDLGRVCEIGSVEVHHLLAVESYAQVHQLVSTVEGSLRPGLGAVDAIAACFPAGSMTGTPKLSAVRLLAGLERGPRGVYSGCFGHLGLDGSADLAMVIRSIRMRGGVASIGAGGGITALSVPEEELAEVRVKAAALLAAAGLGADDGNGRRTPDV